MQSSRYTAHVRIIELRHTVSLVFLSSPDFMPEFTGLSGENAQHSDLTSYSQKHESMGSIDCTICTLLPAMALQNAAQQLFLDTLMGAVPILLIDSSASRVALCPCWGMHPKGDLLKTTHYRTKRPKNHNMGLCRIVCFCEP